MAEVLVIGKKISEMGLVNEITGEEKIPTGVQGDKAVTTGQLLEYLKVNGKVRWGRVEGDIFDQEDLMSQLTQRDLLLQQHVQDKGNPHNVTAGQVGLGNVDNTRDVDKPVSSATQAAIDELSDDVVHSVVGLKGEVTTQQIKDSLDLGNSATYDYENLPPSNVQNDLNQNLNFPYRPFGIDLGRKLKDRLQDYVSVKDFGAIGDNIHHPLSEWVDQGKFNNLADIQSKFPFVTSLDQSIDWCAIQYAVQNHTLVYIPKGSYVLSNVVKTLHNTTPYTIGSSAKGLVIFGDGVQTMLTRKDPRPATRDLNTEGTSTTRESDIANLNEACLAVHSPYVTVMDLSFANSAVGIYLGQDYGRSDSQLSSVAKSNFMRLAFENIGTGMLYLAHGGNHYTNVCDIHFHRCQIDVHLRASYYWKITQGRGDSNNNRNVFTRIRSGRSIVGFWNECGDTNSIVSWHGENMPSSVNTFTKPSGLPTQLTAEACLLVFSGSNQLNMVSNSFAESVAWHVYNDGYQNRFTSVGFEESLVTMVQTPREWGGRYVSFDRGVGFSDNTFTTFPQLSRGGVVYIGTGAPSGANITEVMSVVRDVTHKPYTSTKGSYEKSFQIESSVQAGVPTAINIWTDSLSDSTSSGNIEVTLSASGSNNVSYTAKYIVSALRNSSRTITRYGGALLYAYKSTGEGVLDTSSTGQISLSLQKDSVVNNKNLQLVITSPVELTGVTLFVHQSVQK